MTLQPVAFFPDNQLRVIRHSDPRAGRLLSTQSNRQSRLLLLQIRPTLILLSDTDTTSTRCNSLFRNVAYRALFFDFYRANLEIHPRLRPADGSLPYFASAGDKIWSVSTRKYTNEFSGCRVRSSPRAHLPHLFYDL